MSTTMQPNTPTTMPTTTPIKADHQIKIMLKDGHAVAPATVLTMAVGETVCYSSDDGEVRIDFRNGSPFRTNNPTLTNAPTKTSVPGSVILTLVSDSADGIMEGDCFIILADGTEAGYGPEYPSGVHHKVTPPAK